MDSSPKIYRRQSCCYPIRVALCNQHWLERVRAGQIFTYSEVPVHPVPCSDCQRPISAPTQSEPVQPPVTNGDTIPGRNHA